MLDAALIDTRTPEQAMIDEERTRALDRALLKLPARLHRVLALRFGLDGGGVRTLREIADGYACGAERVRQIETTALRKLRHPANRKAFMPDGWQPPEDLAHYWRLSRDPDGLKRAIARDRKSARHYRAEWVGELLISETNHEAMRVAPTRESAPFWLPLAKVKFHEQHRGQRFPVPCFLTVQMPIWVAAEYGLASP